MKRSIVALPFWVNQNGVDGTCCAKVIGSGTRAIVYTPIFGKTCSKEVVGYLVGGKVGKPLMMSLRGKLGIESLPIKRRIARRGCVAIFVFSREIEGRFDTVTSRCGIAFFSKLSGECLGTTGQFENEVRRPVIARG